MDSMAVIQYLTRRWLRLGKWQRCLLTIVAVLVGAAWIGIGSLGLLILSDSPLGCPPTIGCPERKANDCSSWTAFTQPTSDRETCAGNR